MSPLWQAPDQVCTACRMVYVTDPSGLCEDCTADVASEKPGSLTDDQRLAIIGALHAAGIGASQSRNRFLTGLFGCTWQHGGDLGWLSERQAGDVLERLTEKIRP